MALPISFWTDVEQALEYVLYGDTDSLYIQLGKEYDTIQETIKESEAIAENINGVIKNYFDSYLLPKMGINPIYNKTYFKTELVANAIMLLDTKKNYAFNQVAKEGKIFDPPVTQYTGISVVKSDVPPLTKDLIRDLTEKIALNRKLKTKPEIQAELKGIWDHYWSKTQEHVKTLDLEYISVPCKWGNNNIENDTSQIIGMRLYNTLMDVVEFRENTYGMKIHVKIANPINFSNRIAPIKNTNQFYLNNITVDKINYIVVPYEFNRDLLTAKLNEYHVKIDVNQIWDNLTNTVVHRIKDTIKLTYKIT